MGALIFSCPKTWRVIEPGIETNEATLAGLRSESLVVDCPYCRETHELKVKDGHLFTQRPRRTQIHYPGLLPDEIDVGTLIHRTMQGV